MYNERRLELFKGGGPSLEGVHLLAGSRSKSAIKQRGQSWKPIASIGLDPLSVASHHQVRRGRVELVRKDVHDGFVRGHHDGRVRDLPD